MKISGELIKEYEEFRPYPYKCPAGKWTIGYGSRYYKSGVPVTEEDYSITREMGEELLDWHLTRYVLPVIDKNIPYELSQSQIEALASLIYNVGADAFLKSKLYRAIIEGDNEKIFREWDWIKAGGVVQRGLIRRRVEELNYWFNGF